MNAQPAVDPTCRPTARSCSASTSPGRSQQGVVRLRPERRIDENAFILATTLDSQFNPVTVNTAVVTLQTRTNFDRDSTKR